MLRFLQLFVALVPICAFAQEYAYARLEGTVAGKPVVMHLHRNTHLEYSEGQTLSATFYQGVYYYNQYEIPIDVNGAEENGSLNLVEGSGSMQLKKTGAGKYSGAWKNEQGDKTYPVELNETYPAGSVPFKGAAYYGRKPLFDKRNDSPGIVVQLTWLEPDEKLPEATRSFLQQAIHRETVGKALSCCPGGKKAFETIRDEQFRMYNEEFKETLRSDPDMPETMMNFADEIGVMVLYNSNNLLSLGFQHYFYSGGAHGNYATTTRSYDLQQKKALALTDVFKPGYEKALEKALDQAARRHLGLQPTDAVADHFLVDKIPVTENFYLSGKGIIFSYPPYEIAAYVNGQIDLFIPFSAVKDWVMYK